MDKIILHSDLNNFYASVEIALNPALRGNPVAVCGDPKKRHGIVLAKCNIAKAAGVKTGMTVWQAQKLVPNILIVTPRHDKYAEYSRKVYDIYGQYTSQVESYGLDECWLDVTGSTKLFGDGKEIADKIRGQIKRETSLTASIGVSFSKIFAKLGSDMKKPDATTCITRENYKEKVWPLPVREMVFIGRSTEKKLAALNIFTLGELAHANKTLMRQHFGIVGDKLVSYANGENDSEVKPFNSTHMPESVGNGSTAAEDIADNASAEALIIALSETVAYRLRKENLFSGGLSLSIKDNEFNCFGKQMRFLSPTCNAADISHAAIKLLETEYDFKRMRPIRTITVTAIYITPPSAAEQICFFDTDTQKEEKVERSVDKIRDKYGFGVITRGISVESDFNKDDKEINYIPFKRQ